MSLDRRIEQKLTKLRKSIRKMDSAIVAFSGGVDSSLITRICQEELGEQAVAVTMYSDGYPSKELDLARRIAKVMGVRHVVEQVPRASSNMCKGKMFGSIKSMAIKLKAKNIIDGAHKDDKRESQFSFQAAKLNGVKSPLIDCDISKAEVRLLAKELGLPNWDKIASAERKRRTPIKPSIKKGLEKLELIQTEIRKLGVSKPSLLIEGKRIAIVAKKKDLSKIVASLDELRKKIRGMGFSDIVLRLSS